MCELTAQTIPELPAHTIPELPALTIPLLLAITTPELPALITPVLLIVLLHHQAQSTNDPGSHYRWNQLTLHFLCIDNLCYFCILLGREWMGSGRTVGNRGRASPLLTSTVQVKVTLSISRYSLFTVCGDGESRGTPGGHPVNKFEFLEFFLIFQ